MQIQYAETKTQRVQLTGESNIHLELAESLYEEKRKDKNSKLNRITIIACFDLQKCLPTPFLLSGIGFYKRQLWTYNLTVFQTSGPNSLSPVTSGMRH